MAFLDRIEPLGRQTLGERIHAELSDLLMSGRLTPGERMPIRTLADRLGVSVMPVRDAIGRLAGDGVLTMLPNRAVRVPPMTRARLEELTTVRVEIEGFAAARAALARTEADLATINRHDAAFRAATTAPVQDLEALLRANLELHFAVYSAAGLPTLVAVVRLLWLKVGPALNLDLRATADRIAENAAEAHHAALVAAIAARDPAGARRAIVADIESAAGFILSRLPD